MRALSSFLAGASCITAAGAQVLKIDRCEPAMLVGGRAEITLHGPNLEGAELWTSFPAEVERLDEKAPRFRVTTKFEGQGALRAHSERGSSNMAFVELVGDAGAVVASGNRDEPGEAQELPVPVRVVGKTPAGPCYYRFEAGTDKQLELRARPRNSDFDGVLILRSPAGRRLAYADDSRLHGADPVLHFIPPMNGTFVVELFDSQFRGGQAFELSIVPRIGTFHPVAKYRDDSGEEPESERIGTAFYARFDHAGDVDVYQFDGSKGRFLTIEPVARELDSPAVLRIALTRPDGTVIAETPRDAIDNRILRHRFAEDGRFRLRVTEASGEHGEEYIYGIRWSTGVAPFELSIPRQPDLKHPLRDRCVGVPGGVIELPVQCVRHGYNGAIELAPEAALEAVRASLAEGKSDLAWRARLPGDAAPGELRTVRLVGRAEIDGRECTAPLLSAAAIEERQPQATVPEAVDGLLAVRVVASPVTVKVTAPPEVDAGGKGPVRVGLAWREEEKRFNTHLRIVGLPEGVTANEKGLKAGDTGAELEIAGAQGGILSGLRVEARLDYHGQPLLVQSAPFDLRVKQP